MPSSSPHPSPPQKLSPQRSAAGGRRWQGEVRRGLRRGTRHSGLGEDRGHWETRGGGYEGGMRQGQGPGATRGSRSRSRPGPLVTQCQECGAHPHSAESRCFGVWLPALPPSARTGSGLSGTARTLRGETRWSGPPRRTPLPPPAVGAPAPGPTLQHLPLAHGDCGSAPATSSGVTCLIRRRDDRSGHSGLGPEPFVSVYPRLRGNRPEPERGRLVATTSPGVTSRPPGPRTPQGQPASGELRLQGRPGRAKRAPPQREPGAVECHQAASYGRPPGGHVLYKTTPDLCRCRTARHSSRLGSPMRRENPVKMWRDKETGQWSRLSIDGQKKSHT